MSSKIHFQDTILKKYVDTFRNNAPISPTERRKNNSINSKDFWWLDNSYTPLNYKNVVSNEFVKNVASSKTTLTRDCFTLNRVNSSKKNCVTNINKTFNDKVNDDTNTATIKNNPLKPTKQNQFLHSKSETKQNFKTSRNYLPKNTSTVNSNLPDPNAKQYDYQDIQQTHDILNEWRKKRKTDLIKHGFTMRDQDDLAHKQTMYDNYQLQQPEVLLSYKELKKALSDHEYDIDETLNNLQLNSATDALKVENTKNSSGDTIKNFQFNNNEASNLNSYKSNDGFSSFKKHSTVENQIKFDYLDDDLLSDGLEEYLDSSSMEWNSPKTTISPNKLSLSNTFTQTEQFEKIEKQANPALVTTCHNNCHNCYLLQKEKCSSVHYLNDSPIILLNNSRNSCLHSGINIPYLQPINYDRQGLTINDNIHNSTKIYCRDCLKLESMCEHMHKNTENKSTSTLEIQHDLKFESENVNVTSKNNLLKNSQTQTVQNCERKESSMPITKKLMKVDDKVIDSTTNKNIKNIKEKSDRNTLLEHKIDLNNKDNILPKKLTFIHLKNDSEASINDFGNYKAELNQGEDICKGKCISTKTKSLICSKQLKEHIIAEAKHKNLNKTLQKNLSTINLIPNSVIDNENKLIVNPDYPKSIFSNFKINKTLPINDPKSNSISNPIKNQLEEKIIEGNKLSYTTDETGTSFTVVSSLSCSEEDLSSDLILDHIIDNQFFLNFQSTGDLVSDGEDFKDDEMLQSLRQKRNELFGILQKLEALKNSE